MNGKLSQQLSMLALLANWIQLLEDTVSRAHTRHAEFPSKQLMKTLTKWTEDNMSPGDIATLKATLQPLIAIIAKYNDGLKAHEFDVMTGLLDQYWQGREAFLVRLTQR